MIELMIVSIGIGLAVSLLFGELFAISPGGMVATGYFALYLHDPLKIAATLVASLITWMIVRCLSNLIIIYGRRQVTAMILVGYLVGVVMNSYVMPAFASAPEIVEQIKMSATNGYSIIGYIVPGLIAIWLERQGIIATFSSLLTGSVIVRLILILIFGVNVLTI